MIIGVDARELGGLRTGTGRYLRNLIHHWTRGESRDQIVAYFNGPVPSAAVPAGASVSCRSLNERTTSGLVWQEWVLPPAIRRDRIDVFFSPAYTCPLRINVPRVTAVHDLSYYAVPHDFTWPDAARRRFLVGQSIRASRRILACSAFTRREIERHFPDAAERVREVPLGPDDDLPPPPPRDEARARLGLRGPLVITVGTVLNRRLLPALIQAAALVASGHPTLVLDVVGDNRTHPRLDLARLAEQAGIGGRLRVSGFVTEPDLADRYAAADAAVFLSEYEGFGLPALEAAARGVPLVVSRRPSLGEIFGEAAVTVDPTDARAVAAALERLLAEPGTRIDLAARGRALAARYSWARTASLAHEALREAAGQA